MDRDVHKYLNGEKLYGDDFSAEEISRWFAEEENGYYNLGAFDRTKYVYGYHALNWEHGFRFLSDQTYSSILGVGSAYGDELLPIAKLCDHISILEPSSGFVVKDLNGVPVTYFKPQVTGILPFADNSFDLITCFGVLHHVPNVSIVVNEFYRCLKPNGHLLIREPITSMGDWRKPRIGLTKNERGIPLKIFQVLILSAGFGITRENKCMFSITSRLRYFLSQPVYNSRLGIVIDKLLCKLCIWPDKYHPKNFFHKFRPTCIFYLLHKR